MDTGAWWATVHGVPKELDRTEQLNNKNVISSDIQRGNRQDRLRLESRTPSWAGLWALSYMPSICGSDIPTGKPGPLDGAPGLVARLSVA